MTFLIGVAGGTASGKSSVCKRIIEQLGEYTEDKLKHRVAIVSLDSFYRELTDKEKEQVCKGEYNFDHPNALDLKQLTETLRSIKDGKSVTLTKYDFQENRKSSEQFTICHANVVLVEGILTFYMKDIRDMFDMKLFVDTDSDTRLSRRVKRDVAEYGRRVDQILQQYINFVKPAFEDFCLPTKKYADVIIPRGADNQVAIELIVQHIQDLLVNNSARPRPRLERQRTSSEGLVSRPH